MRKALKTIMAILFFASPAAAGELCDDAERILSCLHPTAGYQGCQKTSGNMSKIFFAGGITGRRYAMTVAWERKDNFMRYAVLEDSAIAPPNKNCPLLGWQPMRTHVTNNMTDADRIKAHVERFWNVPVGAKDADKMIVTIKVSVLPDGTVTGAEIITDPKMMDNDLYQETAISARRAVRAASPLPIPLDKYEQFKDFQMAFNSKFAVGRSPTGAPKPNQ